MQTTQDTTPRSALPRWIWLTAGAAALGIAGIASALALQNARPAAEPTAGPKTTAAAVATHEAHPAVTPTVAACSNCGVVESVQAVKLKGKGSGVGAVAGGVVGGVVGNQFGKGKGRTAMTVLGAVGGGFAGHEIEKNVKAKTVFSVKLRMDDGALLTLQQSQAPAVGARVKVEGSTLHPT